MNIRITASKLEAFLSDAKDQKYEDVISFIKNKNIKTELLDKNLEKAIKTGEEYLISNGIPSKNGDDGKLIFLIELKKNNKPHLELTEDRINYRNISKYVFVKKNQKLIEIIPETEGENGTDVFFSVIKAKSGNPAKIKTKKNLIEENNFIISLVDGVVSYEDDTLSINELLKIDGDVDYSIGNIKFNGTVLINGDIYPEFIVESKSDIIINGSVDSANVIAKGNISVSGCINGNDKTEIRAKTITAGFVNNANLFAEDYIDIKFGCIHSYLESRNSIVVKKLIGGKTIARSEIKVNIAGSHSGVDTEIIVGRDDKLIAELNTFSDKEKSLNEKINDLEATLLSLKKLKRKNISDQKLIIQLEETNKNIVKTKTKFKTVKNNILEINEKINKLEYGTIYIYDTIYPRVMISITNLNHKNNLSIKYIKFVMIGNSINIFDIDHDISGPSKIFGYLYIDMEEYNIEFSSINLKKGIIKIVNNKEFKSTVNQKIKLIFHHAEFNDYYELTAEITKIESNYITFSKIQNIKRRSKTNKHIFYEELSASIFEKKKNKIHKILIEELSENHIYIKSNEMFLQSNLFKINININNKQLELTIQPCGDSINIGELYETKFSIIRIQKEDRKIIKDLIDNI